MIFDEESLQDTEPSPVFDILPVNDVHDLVESVVRSASCTAPGEGIRECSRCDYSESCSYPQKSHHLEQRVVAEGTCMRMETIEVYCTQCNYSRRKYGYFGAHRWVSDGGNYERCSYCSFSRKIGNPLSLLDGVTGSAPTMPTFPVISIDPIWDPEKNRFVLP